MNYFAKMNLLDKNRELPAFNAGQWLVKSIGWTASCLGSLTLSIAALPPVSDEYRGTGLVFCLVIALIAHGLIWWKAVDTNWWQPNAGPGQFWLMAAAKLWLIVLLIFQVWCSYILVVAVALLTDLLGFNDSSPGSSDLFKNYPN